MGIEGLNKLGKRHASDAFFTIPITLLSGLRLAIDGNYWMYSNRSVARKKIVNKTDVALGEPDDYEIRREWFLAALNFVTGWLSHNITPVFTFDGKHPPEKAATQAERRDARTAARAKIDALYAQLRGDILEQPVGIIDELRKELRNYNFIPYEDFELFKMIMKGIGVPALQARGDGEHLCASLCIEGKVAAVFSTDVDNLVYGCPLLITGYSDQASYDEHGFKVSHLDCVRLDLLLEGLKLSHSEFVDLCIMSGCDFNKNMPGYAVIKSYKLIQQYGSIDNLPRQFDTTCLNHLRCREIFAYVPSNELIVTHPLEPTEEPQEKIYDFVQPATQPIDPLNINKLALATARDYLEMVGVSGQIERLIMAYNTATPGHDGHIASLNLALAPRYIPPPPPASKPVVTAQRVTLNVVTRNPATPIMLCASTPIPPKILTLKVASNPEAANNSQ